jgi:hypothetical protein
MANFINHCVFRSNHINAIKEGKKVRYVICDSFGKYYENKPFEEVMYYIKRYNYEDIFILSPSVKSEKNPARRLANKLSGKGIPIYVPNNDEEKLDQDILSGKIVFSTFHQVKGLERKAVIVFNFDNSYFKFYKRNSNPKKCPNEIYVAITRAQERLSLIHHDQNEYLPFLDRRKLRNYTDFINTGMNLFSYNSDRPIDTAVTDLTRHLPVRVLTKAIEYLDIKNVQKKGEIIKIPIKTKQKKTFESVSEITGTAIPAYFEYLTTGKMSISKLLDGQKLDDDIELDDKPNEKSRISINTSGKSNNGYMFRKIKDDKKPNTGLLTTKDLVGDTDSSSDKDQKKTTSDNSAIIPSKLLRMTNKYCAKKSKYVYKVNQINKYDWLSQENLDRCIKRLQNNITKDAKFEVMKEFSNPRDNNLMNRNIIGYIDCIDGNNIWELKCVKELKKEYYIQLGIYAYLFEIEKKVYKERSINKLERELDLGDITEKDMLDKIEEISKICNREYKYYLFNIDEFLIDVNCIKDLYKI